MSSFCRACAIRSAARSARTPGPTTWSPSATDLDPERQPGRLTLITRLGADAVGQRLPLLIRAVPGGSSGRVGVRPHARQHLYRAGRSQDPTLRRHRDRAPPLLRRARGRGHLARWGPRRAHGRRRHRVPRRAPRRCSRTTSISATRRPATRGSTPASRSTSPSRSPTCCGADRNGTVGRAGNLSSPLRGVTPAAVTRVGRRSAPAAAGSGTRRRRRSGRRTRR